MLVADDDPDILRLIERRLTRRGYVVRTAPDGTAALDAIRADPPAVAVLDRMMPGLRGDEVCRRLRADPVTARVPVLLLTARATGSDRSSGLQAGADVYLTKPFEMADLDAALQCLMRRRRAGRS